MQVGIGKKQRFIVHKPHKYVATLKGQCFLAKVHGNSSSQVLFTLIKSLESNCGMGLKLHPLQCLFVVVVMHMSLGVPISQTSKSVITIDVDARGAFIFNGGCAQINKEFGHNYFNECVHHHYIRRNHDVCN
jgi:hypothetical protein